MKKVTEDKSKIKQLQNRTTIKQVQQQPDVIDAKVNEIDINKI